MAVVHTEDRLCPTVAVEAVQQRRPLRSVGRLAPEGRTLACSRISGGGDFFGFTIFGFFRRAWEPSKLKRYKKATTVSNPPPGGMGPRIVV